MLKRKYFPGLILTVILFFIFTASSLNSSPTFPNEKKVAKKVTIILDGIPWGPEDSVHCIGSCDIDYSDTYTAPDGHRMIDVEILEMNLAGPGVKIRKNPGPVSPGSTRGISPGIDFPAESFFDVFYEFEFSELPGDTLINYEPIHLVGTVDQFPPYHEHYSYPMGSPPITLYNREGFPSGTILALEEYILPYYPPEAHIQVETAYRSEVAVLNEMGFVKFTGSVTGTEYLDPLQAEFSIRELGDPGPFTPFALDPDGSGTWASTIHPKGLGDGWCAYFEPGSEPFEEHVYETRVEFFDPSWGYLNDTVIVYIDPTPPIPKFEGIDRDSIAYFNVDSFFDITYEVDDEMPAPGTMEAQVYPLVQSFSRDLTPVDQLGLGTKNDSTSCGPASAASCLKYFADNGYPELDNPEGDESKPDQSGDDIARELQGEMGTNETGTSTGDMVSGIGNYLKGHGQSGWSVGWNPVDDATDLGEMFRELEADSEDVIVLLEDTVTTGAGAGDTMGHWVTLGSHESEQVNEDSTVQRIDFMDPWGGGGTAENKYDVGKDGNGQPTTEGYDLDGEGGSATIAGYIKVSPPEGTGGGKMAFGSAGTFSPPPWIQIDSGICRGNGLIDTLTWNTSGFASGLYLLEVITTNDQGIQCRDLRLCVIPDITTDIDPDIPGVKTGLIKLYPNPFNPNTNIKFSLENDGPVTIAIYDITGRRVRLLMENKKWTAGIHTVTWDGKNNRGRQSASGVYFCRFVATGQTSAMKMIMLR